MVKTIGNPGSWTVAAIGSAGAHIGHLVARMGGSRSDEQPVTRRIDIDDVRAALRAGMDDFSAFRSDVMFAALLYPVIGIVLAFVAFNRDLLPLFIPMALGFAIVGPVAALGLYEMSRRRERGDPASWADGLSVLRSPSIGPILMLALYLIALYVAWLLVSGVIYNVTLGPAPPASVGAFVMDTLTTGPGWAMVILGMGVGLVFAVTALAISLVSFPLLLERDIGLPTAVVTSVRVVSDNPRAAAAWGIVVVAGLVIGSIPVFLGLIVVVPVLGHATWHLYRRAVEPSQGR